MALTQTRGLPQVWRVFENGSQASEALRDRVALLQMLLGHETDRLKVTILPGPLRWNLPSKTRWNRNETISTRSSVNDSCCHVC